MQGDPNNSAARARAILAAWQQRDLTRLEAELSLVPACNEIHDMSFEEQERMELLHDVASQLCHAGDPGEVCQRLLEHLARTGEHPAIRSEKLSFFPCSQSALRTSAFR